MNIGSSTLYRRRKLTNILTQTLSIGAAGIGLGALVLIVWTLFYNGIASINLAIFTEMTPPPGSAGGLLNAIVGSLILSIVGVVVATPIAILAGTYLAEYGRYSMLAKPTRFVTDILLSAPSIVIGLFVYEVMVVPMGHFSAWAGAVALAIIVIPVVVRTTENMLGLVPDSLREAATALGTPRWKVIRSVCYRAARQGIMTGILLAVARVSGETAPLLFTALNNQFWSTDLNAPMSNMPVVIFQFALSPYEDWQKLAWGGALIITLSVLSLNVFARVLVRTKRH
jgi:phosphate transport system permease protein